VNIPQEELKKLFAQEVKKYQTDKESFKDYYLSMKELNLWLAKREK